MVIVVIRLQFEKLNRTIEIFVMQGIEYCTSLPAFQICLSTKMHHHIGKHIGNCHTTGKQKVKAKLKLKSVCSINNHKSNDVSKIITNGRKQNEKENREYFNKLQI